MSVLLCGNAMIVLLYYYCLNNYFVRSSSVQNQKGSLLGSLTICGTGSRPIYSRNSLMPRRIMSSPILSLFFPCSSHHSHIFLITSKNSVYGGSILINGMITQER